MNILILGANGQIARQAIDLFLNNTEADLTLYLRQSERLQQYQSDRVDLVEGDVLDYETLKSSVAGQDLVYANLAGDMEGQAENIIKAMEETDVKRLVFVSTLAIYDEVPGEFGEWNRRTIGPYLAPYRAAADLIEASDLDYTIIRAAWLTDNDEIDYEVTDKSESFKGTEVARKSVAAVVVEIAKDPKLYSKGNIGVNKPDTDGPKPAFY